MAGGVGAALPEQPRVRAARRRVLGDGRDVAKVGVDRSPVVGQGEREPLHPVHRRSLAGERSQHRRPSRDASVLLVGPEQGEAVALERQGRREGRGPGVEHHADVAPGLGRLGRGAEDPEAGERSRHLHPGAVVDTPAHTTRTVAGPRHTGTPAPPGQPVGAPPQHRRQPLLAGPAPERPARTTASEDASTSTASSTPGGFACDRSTTTATTRPAATTAI